MFLGVFLLVCICGEPLALDTGPCLILMSSFPLPRFGFLVSRSFRPYLVCTKERTHEFSIWMFLVALFFMPLTCTKNVRAEGQMLVDSTETCQVLFQLTI